ncbi:uncharacterized protein LOC121375484 [Gigantopelta aegis]|uniref:uncharacterized protein LOC121375484 n=1 Tax=Gigantopelta aegis TaxID=1735272 RepID=UPI001B887636|nr:uncharacterized protein LOC121375484 [Gigantopelta aegis]
MTKPADRVFYSLPQANKPITEDVIESCSKDNKQKLLNYIRDNVIGCDKQFGGPFGLRRVTYLDYIASGRALRFIEDYIQDEVLPEYGNTHTTTGVTSLQTTLFRHEARDIIRNAVNASEHDSVIFVGSGTTGAIHKLIHGLNLNSPPVVFVGPYEHHSNLLPWKEITTEVIRIKQLRNGLVDIGHLETQLQKWKEKQRQMIGSFSAASNITGILVDVDAITACLHRYGALAFWDYATAAPYVKIDMNPVVLGENEKFVYKDAVFLSPHKFIGGVSTPGVLIAKKCLFRNNVPEGGGGGTVFFVRRDSHRYLQEPELREEGGTPAIVESVRAGLVFQLKEAITTDTILEREEFLFNKAKTYWQDCENLVILGNLNVPRLPVFSFLIYHPETGRFLHYNFVSAVLNDVFGIQARGGCACAGPYAQDLLGLGELKAKALENLLLEDWRLDRIHLRRYRECSHKEILRPGFTRLSLPYFIDDDCLQFVLEAVQLVAQHAHSLLPQYTFNPETGEWRQKNFQVFKDRKWLGHISYKSGEMSLKVPPQTEKGPLPSDYQDCLKMARDLFKRARKTRVPLSDQTLLFDEESQSFRWFVLPSEAHECLHSRGTSPLPLPPSSLPFLPQSLRVRLGVEDAQSDEAAESPPDIQETGYMNTNMNSSLNRQSEEPFMSGMVEMLERGFIFQQDAVNTGSCEDPVRGQNSDDPGVKTEDNPESLVSRQDSGTTKYADNKSKECSSCVMEKENSGRTEDQCKKCSSTYVMGEQNSGKTEDKNEKCSTVSVLGEQNSGKIEDKNKRCSSASAVCKENTELYDGDTRGGLVTQSHKDVASFQDVCQAVPDVCCKLNVRNPQSVCKSNQSTDCEQKHQNRWVSPPKIIFKPTVKAIEEYEMIQPGDRVLVCLSGGKDSLSLLHTLRQYQFYAKGRGTNFEFGAVTVDPETPAYDPSPLKQYIHQLGVPYFYESQGILETAENLPYECASICSFCSRMKRGRIYSAARRGGYNVLALGQHLDDLAESFLMSFFHNGLIRTMKAHYTVQEGDLRVIRPFAYVREKELRNFAEKNRLPVIAENCPACFQAPKERHRMKQLLATQELLFPHLYHSMMAAMKPVMSRSSAMNSSPSSDDHKGPDGVGRGKSVGDGEADDYL